MKAALLTYLSSYLTPRRQKLIRQNIRQRTRHVTLVLEDFYQPHNYSAVLRSCDAFGIQDVHIIENQFEYSAHKKVNMGSDKWLNLTRYNEAEHNTRPCLSALKQQGYRIVVAHPHEQDVSLYDLRLEQKTAILFGTELTGATDVALDMADEFMRIPMYGFVESFNVSVAAALTLSHLRQRLEQFPPEMWKLDPEEQLDVQLDWIRRSIRSATELERNFLKKYKG